MRLRFKPSREQRAALRLQLERFQQPAAVRDVLGSSLPADVEPAGITCIPHSVLSDRFVVRVVARLTTGEERAYALKVYADDFGEQVWAHAQAVARHWTNDDGPCLPTRYIPHERTLVFPWVVGSFLSDIVDRRRPELLRRAAALAADLHRLPVVPEAPTTPDVLIEDTRGRCDRLRARAPEHAPTIERLLARLEDALPFLDPADPAPVHGDMAAGQFVWTGERLVLLDLDMFGYTDPAYDVGHFLAQLERRSLQDGARREDVDQWVTGFRDAYLSAMPQVSPRNVAFYQGLTFVRKIYTVCRTSPPDRAGLVSRLAARARAALDEAVSLGQPR
jgi:tRNA A-37 threonylcarbamoyl transferase component Bud32